MNQICWIAVDERSPSGNPYDVADMLLAAPSRFSAAVLDLDLDTASMELASRRLKLEFGVSIVPVIGQELLRSRLDAVLTSLAVLMHAGVLEGDGKCPPIVLVRPSIDNVGFDDAISRIRRALEAEGNPLVGWVNCTGTATRAPPGFDFTVDWPGATNFAPTAAGQDSRSDALNLAIAAGLTHANDGAVAPSALVSADVEGRHGLEGGAVSGLYAPVEQLWLDVVRRFAANRLGFGLPCGFVRLVGDRESIAPPWLKDALGNGAHSSWSWPQPMAPVSAPQDGVGSSRIAVVIHLYYPELWPEFREAIEVIPEAVDVYVSTPMLIADAVRMHVRRDRPDAVVFGTKNLGRDVRPFLHVLRSVGVDRYQYVLKLHSKKSLHMGDKGNAGLLGGGDAWRRQAIEELAGSAKDVSRLLRFLDDNESIGIVAPAGQLFSQEQWECNTGNLVAHLCRGLNASVDSEYFPAGTMFWIRPAAIAPLISADSRFLDFEREAGQVDGTLHHAIERAVGHIAKSRGYRVVDTSATRPAGVPA